MFDGGRAVTCVGGSSCVPEDLVIFSVLVRVPKDLIRTCTVQYVLNSMSNAPFLFRGQSVLLW